MIYILMAQAEECENSNPDHVIDYIDDCSLVYYKCRCIRDRG